MLRFYGVDLLDYHRGHLSARRLRVLAQHLPRESALMRAAHGEAADWGIGEHLLAAAIDHLAAGNWMFATAHASDRASPPPRPEPVPRPGLEGHPEKTPSQTRSATPEEIAAFLGSATPKGGKT